MTQTATDPLVGTTVAHYEILAKLGGGGMGIVYSARDTRLGRRVALKFLPPQWNNDESAKQRFIREAQAASATDHRNICTIHDIATAEDGRLFIVMAQYDGPTLKQQLENGPLPVEDAIDVAAQVAEGLARAHAQGVVHRDIKPGNLILAEDGVRILDFGLARFAGSLQLTTDGSTLGTVSYMSPEQARGDDADPRSDVWSAGVVLYEMLTGQLPFKGGYAEAITHAIRNDPTPALRLPGGEPADALERVVRRALEKDPAQRYQSAREFARDLRLIQGRTIPIDLMTGPVSTDGRRDGGSRRKSRAWRTGLATAAAVVALVGVLVAWVLLYPAPRVPVAVAPVVNQTGFAELEPFRLALTQELIEGLSSSDIVRVLSYDRLLQIVRRYTAPGRDVSSRDALKAIGSESGASVIVIPTLLYDNGAWHARLEFRNPATATDVFQTFDGPRVVSSLVKDTAYGQMPVLADAVEQRLRDSSGTRALARASLLSFTSGRRPAPKPRFASLDASAALARALDAYEAQEYGQAAKSVAAGIQLDPRSPLLHAWQSRIAAMMRQETLARDSGQRAAELLTAETPESDRLLVDAISAEAARDAARATAAYEALANRRPDDARWLVELAAFQDRQAGSTDAIATYARALSMDGRLARPHLEMCRLYNRRAETTRAREEAQLALMRYRELGHEGGEALALLCLADGLRVGTQAERQQSRDAAERATAILKRLNLEYNLPRGYYYIGLAAGEQGQLSEATRYWEQAADEARSAGNTVLEQLLLMNLAVAHDRLGHGERAIDSYVQASNAYQRSGDELRAAQAQANAAAGRTFYGDKVGAIRELENARAVSQRLKDSDFETFCWASLGLAHQFGGRYTEAEQELNRGLAIARQNDLKQKTAWITGALAALRLELGDYAAARTLAIESVGLDDGRQQIRSRIILGRIDTRSGDFESAARTLQQAAAALGDKEDSLQPMLAHALGELAHEQNRTSEARTYFARAAAFGDPLNEWSVEARGYLALYEALANARAGRQKLEAALGQARQIGRFDLEHRIRAFIARAAVTQRDPNSALAILSPVPLDDAARQMGVELRAVALYWRAEARGLAGDVAGASSDTAAARSLVERMRASLPATSQTAFTGRQDLRALLN